MTTDSYLADRDVLSILTMPFAIGTFSELEKAAVYADYAGEFVAGELGIVPVARLGIVPATDIGKKREAFEVRFYPFSRDALDDPLWTKSQ